MFENLQTFGVNLAQKATIDNQAFCTNRPIDRARSAYSDTSIGFNTALYLTIYLDVTSKLELSLNIASFRDDSLRAVAI